MPKIYQLYEHIYNVLQMTEVQRWKTNQWLPGVKAGGKEGHSLNYKGVVERRSLQRWNSSVSLLWWWLHESTHAIKRYRTEHTPSTSMNFLVLILQCSYLRCAHWGKFPGCLVVRTLHCHCSGSIHGQGAKMRQAVWHSQKS